MLGETDDEDSSGTYSVEVELMKEDRGLGLSIVSRKEERGVYICDIVPGGVAGQDGRLEQGDQVLSVGDQSLESASKKRAVAVLKAWPPGKVLLKIRRWREGEGKQKTKQDLQRLSEKVQQEQEENRRKSREAMRLKRGLFGRETYKKNWAPFYYKERDVFVCKNCGQEFALQNQIRRHLMENMECGSEEEEMRLVRNGRRGVIQTSFKGLYSRDGETYACGACMASFHTQNGIRCHLKKFICGYGSQTAKTQRLDYKGLYTRQDNSWSCNCCQAVFTSQAGIHHHLRKTHCGFGKEGTVVTEK